MKQKAFCGEGNRHCSECLKNAVIYLLCNGEDKFLNEHVNIHVLLLTLMSKSSTLCMEDGRIDVLQVGLCMVIFKTVLIHTKCHITLDTSEYHRSLHDPPLNTRGIAVSCYCGQASAYCDVSSLLVLLEAEAGLPTGMDGRGSCPNRASISLIRVSQKSLCEIFFPPHEDKRM